MSSTKALALPPTVHSFSLSFYTLAISFSLDSPPGTLQDVCRPHRRTASASTAWRPRSCPQRSQRTAHSAAMAAAVSATSSPGSSISSSTSTEPTTDNGDITLLASPAPNGNLRLRFPRTDKGLPPQFADYGKDLSPAPSLLALHSSPGSPDFNSPASESAELYSENEHAEVEGAPFGATRHKRSVSDAPSAGALMLTALDEKQPKSPRRKRAKTPLLDALKLAPLSEISIPRPEQIK